MKNEEILALQEELKRLKGQLRSAKAASVETKIEERDYNGNPVLSFQGSFRPFSLGRNKIRMVLENRELCEQFIMKYNKSDSDE